jgi:acetolactate synthase-1/2/3 large subunit
MLRSSLRAALSGRKGPVHLNLPADFMKRKVPSSMVPPENYRIVSGQFDRNAIKQASDRLLHARKACILAGSGVNLSGAHEELRQLAERLRIPVATTPQGKGAFPENHMLSLGVFGLAGSPLAEQYILSEDPDLLLVVGTSLGEASTCNWDARLGTSRTMIQIDIDPCEIGKNYPADIGIVGDARSALRELGYQVERDLQWLERPEAGGLTWFKSFKAATPARISPERMDAEDVPLKPQRVMKEMREALPADAALFVDIGTCMSWAIHYYPVYKPGTFFINMGFASMGHAVASCIGGQLARPGDPVVALSGDAAFAMNGMEVHTAVDNDIPAIWVVLNNGGNGMVHHGEMAQFGGRFNTSMYNRRLDITGIAAGLGAAA